ncbi:hypothetical protein D9M69_688160 [compost metagenome]
MGCFSLRLFTDHIDDAANVALAEQSGTWATENLHAFQRIGFHNKTGITARLARNLRNAQAIEI